MTTSDRGRTTVPARDPPAGEAGAAQSTLSELQGEVISAVRGAITGVMAGRQTAADMPDIDMDFSVAAPSNTAMPLALRAEPDRALAGRAAANQPRWPRGLLFAAVVGAAGASGAAAWLLQDNLAGPPRLTAAASALPASSIATTSALTLPIHAATSAAPVAAPVDPLTSARDLMQRGRIAPARKLLLAAPDAMTSAIALEMARSYDPNYLDTLPSPDAAPDLDQARAWYRRWYDLALKEGTVPSTMRLDLLLRSLERPKSAN